MSSGDEQSPTEGEEETPKEETTSTLESAVADPHEHDPGEESGDASGVQTPTDSDQSDSEAVGQPEHDDEEAPDVDPEPVIMLPDPMAELQEQYDDAQARLRTVSKAYRDLQGEMASFRERMEARSKFESERQAFDQARRFFDPVMNLKRSLQQPTDDVDALRNGLEMVQRQFLEAMDKLGLEEVPGIGSNFDPQVHEALAVTPVTDPAQDGKVLMVHTSGFMVKGKVLQAAQVVIGKHEPDAGEA